jgi:hypothetical protein
MSCNRSDGTLVYVRQQSERAEPLKQIFIESGLTNFIERLNVSSLRVRRRLTPPPSRRGSNAEAVSGFRVPAPQNACHSPM